LIPIIIIIIIITRKTPKVALVFSDIPLSIQETKSGNKIPVRCSNDPIKKKKVTLTLKNITEKGLMQPQSPRFLVADKAHGFPPLPSVSTHSIVIPFLDLI
jgi:hypothetical protein